MKAKIEKEMEEKLKALRAEYDAHSLDVQNVLSHKMKAME